MESTNQIRIALLPGLHGTELPYRSFLALGPTNVKVIPFSYSTQDLQSYEVLSDIIFQRLNEEESKLILLGESFSGPLSLLVAKRKPKGLAGVILAASFVLPPRQGWAKLLPWEFGCKFAKVAYGLRTMVPSRYSSVIRDVNQELARISPSVLADRIRSTLAVDVTSALRECPVPILYIVAEKDVIIRKTSLKQILAIRSDVAVQSINAPHFVLPYAAKEVWSVVLPFVDNCCAA